MGGVTIMSSNQKVTLIMAIGVVTTAVVGAMCYTVPKMVTSILKG